MEKRVTHYLRIDRKGTKLQAFVDVNPMWLQGQVNPTRAVAEVVMAEWNRLVSDFGVRYQLVDEEAYFTPEFPGFDTVHGT